MSQYSHTTNVLQSLLASDDGLSGLPPDSKDAIFEAVQQRGTTLAKGHTTGGKRWTVVSML
eukprot:5050581-Pyramimonas_sp.AAC.1